MTSTKPVEMPLPPVHLADRTQRTILLFGDSHSHAVHLAVEKRLSNGASAPLAVFRPRKEKKSGIKFGNTSFGGFLDRISRLGPDDVVLSALGGNQYATFSTIQHPQPFDFYTNDPGAAVTEGIEIIPYRALSEYLAASISRESGSRLKALRNATNARVVHLIPPPPKEDNEFIAQIINRDSRSRLKALRYATKSRVARQGNESIAFHHEKFFAAQGATSLDVTPPELRLKCWLLQERILYKMCHKYGVEVMPPPSEAIHGGFLRPKYYGADSTHANRLYGELVLLSVETQFLRNGKLG